MTNNDISKVYMGVDEVDKIYLGTDLIYPTTPPTPPDYSLMPLTFEVLSDGDIMWVATTTAGTTAKTIEYNLNNAGWSSITSNVVASAPTISVHSGDTIQFRGNNNQYGFSNSNYNYFSGSAQFNAYGNIMSLIDSTGYTTMVGFPSSANQVFGHMFYKNDGIVSAENLVLPATAFSGNNVYSWMFASATSLTIAPELPATELKTSCYGNMFYRCSSLTEAPVLPAKTLAPSCYTSMFINCNSLNYIKCLATDISASSCTQNWVSNVASAGTFVKDVNMNDWTIGVNGIPVNWVIQDYPDYSVMPLTFEIISAGTITWKKSNNNMADRVINYSTDDGDTWNTITSTTAGTEINVNAGDKVMFAGNNAAYGTSTFYTHFGGTAIFKAYGNIMSLVDNVGYETATTLVSGYTFRDLFNGCSGLTDASNLILPATTLQIACYRQIFAGCSNLVAGPELPATTLAQSCYNGMFWNCTSLLQAPELPATTLANSCYYNMFLNCTSLLQAPELPATTLANSCYYGMFYGCTSLTTAPELPATTLTNFCYQQMFYGCSNLNYIKCLATDISASNSTSNWVQNVASAGTFVKDANMTSWSSGVHGIPAGWTVVDAS